MTPRPLRRVVENVTALRDLAQPPGRVIAYECAACRRWVRPLFFRPVLGRCRRCVAARRMPVPSATTLPFFIDAEGAPGEQ